MQAASKKVCWKNKRVPNTCCDISNKKGIFSELKKCIFQISLKYIKLDIPEILFILVLCNFDFYFKITWPHPHPHLNQIRFFDPTPPPPAKTFLKFLTPSPKLEGGGGCMPWDLIIQLKLVSPIFYILTKFILETFIFLDFLPSFLHFLDSKEKME